MYHYNIKVLNIIIAIIWCNTCMGCTYSWSLELFLNDTCFLLLEKPHYHQPSSVSQHPIFNRTCWYNQTNASNSFFVWVPHERAVAMAMEVCVCVCVAPPVAGWGRCRRRCRLSRPSKKKLALSIIRQLQHQPKLNLLGRSRPSKKKLAHASWWQVPPQTLVSTY